MKTLSSFKALLILVFTFGIAQSSVAEERRTIELSQVQSLLKEILMFSGKYVVGQPSGVPDAKENFDYSIGVNCTKEQSKTIENGNIALIKGFLTKPSIAPRKTPLNEADIKGLKTYIFGMPSEGTTNNGCENHITFLRNAFTYFNTFYNKGFYIESNPYTYGLVSSKLLAFGQEFHLTHVLATLILTYNSIRVANPSLQNDSGFAIFLVSKFHDYGADLMAYSDKSDPASAIRIEEKRSETLKNIALQYRIYSSILTTALKTQKPDVLDSLIAYSELTKIIKSERGSLERFRTKDYIATLLKISESFKDLAVSPRILNQVAAAEEITTKAIQHGLGSRENIMSFVVIELEGIDNSDHMKVFNEVALEMRKGIWNPLERKIERENANDTVQERRQKQIEVAARILKITRDIITIAPKDLNKALALCKNARDQFSKERRELVNINVSEEPKVKGI